MTSEPKQRPRKKVYWVKQDTMEHFEFCTSMGWVAIDNESAQWWKPSTYEYHEQVASDESFTDRIDGKQRI